MEQNCMLQNQMTSAGSRTATNDNMVEEESKALCGGGGNALQHDGPVEDAMEEGKHEVLRGGMDATAKRLPSRQERATNRSDLALTIKHKDCTKTLLG